MTSGPSDASSSTSSSSSSSSSSSVPERASSTIRDSSVSQPMLSVRTPNSSRSGSSSGRSSSLADSSTSATPCRSSSVKIWPIRCASTATCAFSSWTLTTRASLIAWRKNVRCPGVPTVPHTKRSTVSKTKNRRAILLDSIPGSAERAAGSARRPSVPLLVGQEPIEHGRDDADHDRAEDRGDEGVDAEVWWKPTELEHVRVVLELAHDPGEQNQHQAVHDEPEQAERDQVDRQRDDLGDRSDEGVDQAENQRQRQEVDVAVIDIQLELDVRHDQARHDERERIDDDLSEPHWEQDYPPPAGGAF